MQTSPTTYEDFIAMGQEFAQTKDKMQWSLGDLAIIFMGSELVKQGKKGEITLKKLANNIGVTPRSMQEYHSMANFYPLVARADFAPTINYTKARIAKSYGKNLEYAMELLETAAHQSTGEFLHHLKSNGETVQPQPDDMIRIPRYFLCQVVQAGQGVLNQQLIEQLKEYLHG